METYIKEKHYGRRQMNPRSIPNTQPLRRTTQITTNSRKVSEPTDERRFEYVNNQPLSQKATLKCTKCGRMGHAAERCFARNFPTPNQRNLPPRRVNQIGTEEETMDEYESTVQEENCFQYICDEGQKETLEECSSTLEQE
ncbi:hypothetical protein ANTRET_LOCUS22 [Anthophora retusa]